MPFSNEITGGQGALVRPAIKSPNFVSGVSGWSIDRDGSAEFTDLTIDGSTTSQIKIEFTDGSSVRIYAGAYAALGDGAWIEFTPADVAGITWEPGVMGTEVIATVPESAGLILISPAATGCPSASIQLESGATAADDSIFGVDANFIALDGEVFSLGAGLYGSEEGISNAGAADSTTSATYVNLAGTSSFTFRKLFADSRVRIDMAASYFVSAGSTGARFGARINGTDFDVMQLFQNVAASHVFATGSALISGLPADNNYTVQGRWRRFTGAGTCQRDANDWLTIMAREVD